VSLPRILVPDRDIAAGRLIVPDKRTLHHLRDVLRLGTGDRLVLVDGNGTAFTAELTRGDDGPGLAVIGEAPTDRAVKESFPVLVIMALLKSDLTEMAIRKATEAGVGSLRVTVCDRSVPRPASDALQVKAERFRRVAAEAARQCGRATVPTIEAFSNLDGALESLPRDWPCITLQEAPGTQPLSRLLSGLDTAGVTLAAGPEGSFTPRETDLMEKAGFLSAGLGPRVLRAETAVIAAVVVAQVVLGDMG